jgi:acyl-coenzyme A synthetase/AMP-(fatty) acid ligase/acyl carrier protein
MLEDSQAALLVTNDKNLSRARALARNSLPLVNIDGADLGSVTTDPGLSISPDGLVYILYTSGSTGRPKGVLQNHRNVLHQIRIYTNTLRVCAHDRFALLGSSTGQAINTMLAALLNGAAAHPFNLKDEGFALLAGWLVKEKITVYSAVTTVFRNFAAALPEGEQFPELRLIYVGGEPIRKTDAELYKTRFSRDCLFVARLGISEAGTVRYYFVDKQTQIASDVVPLGYAVDDMELVLLDERRREIGCEQIGEIAIRSRHLALGYWRNPEATEAAFLGDPTGGDRRVYLTGDLGRMLPDGCLLHCGRKDFRVKVRGYNVEPMEIESALLDVDGIKEAVVVGHESTPGAQRLVAYVVPQRPNAPGAGALRRALAQRLPGYMIPSAFVTLEAIPRTANGKVDRRALPDPGNAKPELDTPYVAPRTPVEEQLAQIWAEVLSFDRIGTNDNFFDLGGHSIAATRVVSQVIKKFQLQIPLRSLFQSPTIASMAAVITECQAKKLDDNELNRILADVESLSEDEARRLFADHTGPASRKH